MAAFLDSAMHAVMSSSGLQSAVSSTRSNFLSGKSTVSSIKNTRPHSNQSRAPNVRRFVTPSAESVDQGYTMISDDPEDLQKALDTLTEENGKLREKVLQEHKLEAGYAEEAKKENNPKARLNINAVAPTSTGSTPGGSPAVPPTPTATTGSSPAVASTTTIEKAPTSDSAPSAGTNSTLSQERNASLERESAKAGENQEYSKKTENPISIVFVSSEVAPYSKTGGLADVVGSLPVALAARGHRVMVVAPRYLDGVNDKAYKGVKDLNKRIKCYLFQGAQEVAFFHEFRNGVDYVFVDHPSYHRPGTPYGDSRGTFGDNQFRFALLCHAACEAPLQLELGGYTYGEKVLFFANDWHAGLVPVLVASKYRKYGVYKDARTFIAIHNLSHQGVEPATTFENLGIPGDWYGAVEWVFPEWARKHAFDKGEAVNILKGAIVTSDRVVTVSPGYAWEITTTEGGWGLDGMLRSRSFVLNGVTNGIDMEDWDPQTDKNIPANFSADDLSGKAKCKAELQRELGLQMRPDVPLIGFIGRLDWQKGPDIIQQSLPWLMSDDVQFVMLGSGDTELETWMTWAETEYHDKFRGWVGFSVPVAHKITAGCDILLMPSRFEPCGLNQLYAMRYGTVPVVHSTGGLRDTVEEFNPFANGGAGSGTGWSFSPLSKEAMMGALWTAIATYREHNDSWSGIMKRGMTQDMSWDRAAVQYEQLFEWAMTDPPYA